MDDTSSLFRQAPGLSLTSFDDGRFAYFQLRGIGPLSQAIGPDDGSGTDYVCWAASAEQVLAEAGAFGLAGQATDNLVVLRKAASAG